MLKAISPLISTVLIILLLVGAIAIVLSFGKEILDKTNEANVINEAKQNMKLLDNIIRQIASSGTGSLKKVQLKVSDGIYKVIQETNSLEFFYTVKYGTIEPGTYLKENNLLLISGATAKAYEGDLDNDGVDELVLENEILKIGVQKLGSRSSFQPINTRNNIKIMIFKENNATIRPEDSSIIFDDIPETSYGNGFSELVRKEEHLAKAEALVHVNSTLIEYDIIYTLQAGADYLVVRILNAYYK
ncbi:MAG: hypothetical protein QXP77_02125 [Candidatus Aenigmatarchaeota archaeon]